MIARPSAASQAAQRKSVLGGKATAIVFTNDHANGESVQELAGWHRMTVIQSSHHFGFYWIDLRLLRILSARDVDRILIKLFNDTVGLNDSDYPHRGILLRLRAPSNVHDSKFFWRRDWSLSRL
ncbi:MAG: hypothetical protein ABI150_07440 [Nitrobacter sp.]